MQSILKTLSPNVIFSSTFFIPSSPSSTYDTIPIGFNFIFTRDVYNVTLFLLPVKAFLSVCNKIDTHTHKSIYLNFYFIFIERETEDQEHTKRSESLPLLSLLILYELYLEANRYILVSSSS